MPWPLELIEDLAVVRGGRSDDDPGARFLRGRIASAAWPIAGVVVWLLAAWLKSWQVGVLGVVIVLVAMWLFAERPTLVFRKRRPVEDSSALQGGTPDSRLV